MDSVLVVHKQDEIDGSLWIIRDPERATSMAGMNVERHM